VSAAKSLGEWLAEEPFGLTMSSGFFAFFAHTGLLSSLLEAGLTPESVSGSSAGALVTGAYASGLGPDDLTRELVGLRREHFWDPAPGLGFLRGELFLRRLESMMPSARLEDARVPVAISVHDVVGRRTRVLASGPVATAIRASCSVPLLFHPVRIEGRAYVDGGVSDRPGLLGMKAKRVLYHHIASRSPWRSARSMDIPRRTGMVTLVIDDLPRSGPFRLDAGRRALEVAREAMRRMLDQPVQSEIHAR
jgi:NTE family protein